MPTKVSWNCCLTCKHKGHIQWRFKYSLCVFWYFSISLCSFINYVSHFQDCKAKSQLRTDFILFPCINVLTKTCSPSTSVCYGQFLLEEPKGVTKFPHKSTVISSVKKKARGSESFSNYFFKCIYLLTTLYQNYYWGILSEIFARKKCQWKIQTPTNVGNYLKKHPKN